MNLHVCNGMIETKNRKNLLFMKNSLQAECGAAIMSNSWQFMLKDKTRITLEIYIKQKLSWNSG